MSWSDDSAPAVAAWPVDAPPSSSWSPPPAENRIVRPNFEDSDRWLLTSGAELLSDHVLVGTQALRLRVTFGLGTPVEHSARQNGIVLASGATFLVYAAILGIDAHYSDAANRSAVMLQVDRGNGVLFTLATFDKAAAPTSYVVVGPYSFTGLGSVGAFRVGTMSFDAAGLFFGNSDWWVDACVLRVGSPVYTPDPSPGDSWTAD